MAKYHSLGVDWLDRCFSKALDQEEVQRNFSLVSDSLGPLVVGNYDTNLKQSVILSLLGPAFVCKHFRNDEAVIKHIRSLEKAQEIDTLTKNEKFSATLIKVQCNLENMALLAMKKSFPPGREKDEVKETVRRLVSDSLLAAASHTNISPDGPDFESLESVLSNSIAAIIKFDRKERFNLDLMKKVKEKFARKSIGIPAGLRKTVWDSYLNTKTDKIYEDTIEISNNSNKVLPQTARHVIDMFHTWPGLRDFEDKFGYFQLTVTRTLSNFYPDLPSDSTAWLVPLLDTFGSNLLTDAEDESFQWSLGLKLMTVGKKCRLRKEEIFSLVDEVYIELEEEDPEYHQHLALLSQDVHRVHEKDFDLEMIVLNDDHCRKIIKTIKKTEGYVSDQLKSTFSDSGKIYVRQWVQHGFVTVLNKECLLYVWDSLFLTDWSRRTLKIVVTAMMVLLRFWMFRGRSYRGMRNTLLREPFNIFLLDLKKAVLHLSNGGKLSECPQSTNWQVKVVPRKPYWQEIQIRRDSLVKKIDNESVGLADVIGIIKSNFKRQDSVSSVESVEKVDAEPWLELWQPYSEDHDRTLPQKIPRLSGTFDLYLDGIRFLPESISVAKITGNIFNLEMDLGGAREFPSFPVEIDCFPDLNSFARHPSFHYRLPINREKRMLNPNAILYLKIFGYEEHSGRIVLVGATLFNLFQSVKGSPLNYGGHQLQCRRGTPELSQARLEQLQAGDVDTLDVVPGLTVLLRLQLASEDQLPPPFYETGYYKSHLCRPNPTDILFYKSYYQAEGFSTRSVKKNVLAVRNKTQQSEDVKIFIKTLFSSLDEEQLIDPVRFHRFSGSVGLRLRLERMFGLPARWDSRYYQGLVTLLDLNSPDRPLARLLSQNYLMSSQLRSPQWEDESHLMTVPGRTDSIVAVVRFYSFKPEYTASWEKQPEGRLGGNLQIDVNNPEAWSLCPLFSGDYIRSGYHYLPLFKGDLADDVLSDVQQFGVSAKTFQVNQLESVFDHCYLSLV